MYFQLNICFTIAIILKKSIIMLNIIYKCFTKTEKSIKRNAYFSLISRKINLKWLEHLGLSSNNKLKTYQYNLLQWQHIDTNGIIFGVGK